MTGRDPYRHSAPLYDFTVGPLNIILKRKRLRLAPPRPGLEVLDVGCGTGADLKLYRRAGCRVSGVDLSPAMLKTARKKLGAGADLRPGDAAKLPFPDKRFDLVLATFLLHELARKKRAVALAEMTRVLRDHGRMLLTDFQPGPYRFPLGWLNRGLIYALEAGAGFAHLKNGLGFVRRGGLPALLRSRKLLPEALHLAGGGVLAFLLLRPAGVAPKLEK